MISNKAIELSSVEHYNHSLNTWKNGEESFIKACKLNNIDYKKSNKNEDINHIDFWIYGKGIDIKGFKKSHQEGFIVVEFKNVQGNAGSCSDGSGCEWIAFQFENCFWIVRKEELLTYCRKNVAIEYVNDFENCYKKLYSRKGRNDLMTKLHLTDIKNFNFIWKLCY